MLLKLELNQDIKYMNTAVFMFDDIGWDRIS